MSKFILSIDQGTTGSTAMLMNLKGNVVAKCDQDFKQIYPKPGWVEHNPKDIWNTVQSTIKHVMKKANAKPGEILTIGITNQRETIVAWDGKTGEPLANAIVWQCRRTIDFCKRLKQEGRELEIKKITGLILDPYFSGSKINWLLKNNSKVQSAQKKGTLKFGTIDSYLIYKLTQGESHCTDVSNASRTMLMDLKTLDYSPEMLKLFEIEKSNLPQIIPSAEHFGATKGLSFLKEGTPITGVVGDQQSALFGQGCYELGDLKVTFGTGSFLLFNTGEDPKVSNYGLLTTLAWKIKNEKPVYALEGGAFICGAAVQWLRDEMQFIKKSSEVEQLAKKVKDSGGVYLVPSFVGLGAPHWDSEARGIITGITRGTNRNHLSRATLEAMALQNVDIIEAMSKDSKTEPKQIRVDGGATENNLLMQMQADFMGINILRPKNIETTAIGAAFMAGIGIGVWQKQDILKLNPVQKTFVPKLAEKDRAQKLSEWHMAIDRARSTQ